MNERYQNIIQSSIDLSRQSGGVAISLERLKNLELIGGPYFKRHILKLYF